MPLIDSKLLLANVFFAAVTNDLQCRISEDSLSKANIHFNMHLDVTHSIFTEVTDLMQAALVEKIACSESIHSGLRLKFIF